MISGLCGTLKSIKLTVDNQNLINKNDFRKKGKKE